jgi:hypothetical protein
MVIEIGKNKLLSPALRNHFLHVPARTIKQKFLFLTKIQVEDRIDHGAFDAAKKVSQKSNAIFVAVASQNIDLNEFNHV